MQKVDWETRLQTVSLWNIILLNSLQVLAIEIKSSPSKKLNTSSRISSGNPDSRPEHSGNGVASKLASEIMAICWRAIYEDFLLAIT